VKIEVKKTVAGLKKSAKEIEKKLATYQKLALVQKENLKKSFGAKKAAPRRVLKKSTKSAIAKSAIAKSAHTKPKPTKPKSTKLTAKTTV
jgi:hypothetical protein